MIATSYEKLGQLLEEQKKSEEELILNIRTQWFFKGLKTYSITSFPFAIYELLDFFSQKTAPFYFWVPKANKENRLNIIWFTSSTAKPLVNCLISNRIANHSQ